MNFSDLVKKLDELGNTQEVELDPKTGKPVEDPQQPQQTPQTGGPVERPIPGQQPSLGPRTTVPTPAPTQPVGAQPQQQQQQPQQQQPADGMAAAILQALGQLKQTQNPLSTATTSQSIAAQKAQAQAQPLQQIHKPGEPTEDIDVNEDAPKKTILSDKEISDWIYSLNTNPSNIQSDNWKNIDPESKKKIILSDKLKPTAYGYIEAHNKLNAERKKEKPDEDKIAELDNARREAWKKHNATPPEKTQADNKTEPKVEPKKEPKQDPKADPKTQTQVTKPTADQIAQQEKIAQSLGAAYATAKDPAQKEAALKAYQEAGNKLTQMKKDAGVETPPPSDTNKPPAGEKKAQVSASELQKFRDEQGNQNITLGQYLNYKNKLSAVKGGANDPSVIQKSLGDKGTAWDPSAKKPTEPIKQASVGSDDRKVASVQADGGADPIQDVIHGKTIDSAKAAYDAWAKGDVSNLRRGQNMIDPKGNLYWYEPNAEVSTARGDARRITQVGAEKDNFIDPSVRSALQATGKIPSDADLEKLSKTPDTRSFGQKYMPTGIGPGQADPTKFQLNPPTATTEPVKNTPAKVEPTGPDGKPEVKPSTYQPVKKDSQGKTYLDPFNVGPSTVGPDTSKLQPGEGPVVRNISEPTAKAGEVKPVKEMSLQSVVDELLQEDKVAKEDATSTASKWATKSAKLAPWVGNAAKAGNVAISASDIADYTKKGDKIGAGIASAALAADAIGTVFPPASWASFALDAANAGRDVYLKQTGQEYKDPDEKQMQAKEELSNIVHLSKYKVDRK